MVPVGQRVTFIYPPLRYAKTSDQIPIVPIIPQKAAVLVLVKEKDQMDLLTDQIVKIYLTGNINYAKIFRLKVKKAFQGIKD